MKKLFTALLFVLATAVWAGDFEGGVAVSKKGDYKTAFSFYKKTDAQDVSEAQLILGEWVLEDVVVSSHTLRPFFIC